MISIIASDMDGTLLNDKMEVSDENAKAIKLAQANGIEFIVATGRQLAEAKPLLAAQDIHPAFITLNGAQVYDELGKLAVNIPLSKRAIDYITKTLRAEGLYFELVTDEGVVSDNKAQRIQTVADLLATLNPGTPYKLAVVLASARLELMNIHYVDNYQEIIANPKREILKIIAFSKGDYSSLDKPRQLFSDDPDLVVTSSSANNIEINDRRAQKGFALEAYAKQRGIKMSQAMAIGDNLNDKSMIRMAGIGVAMGNANPVIKKLANYQTATNVENGVAKAIRHAIAFNASELYEMTHR
ncbi:hydrolase of the HAD superfamily protein [Lactobacillus selangorensis]|uniref:Hydrolase of the HAD superfamily protein n=1 Tax=Lactobacillus selangorensis TaxID=81857 RepID=A0A0R2FG97_9LACO|nr:Cof-type HAD-IIB family hydrolase [Lactobacillus selangorensis]KRN27657.1 hydrolase of the HAD superfamily protein [Lactobacillus selangorensis]KRN30376.1 hydrolase of the HAD superfamily protein [Lactobacillus selangorensis]